MPAFRIKVGLVVNPLMTGLRLRLEIPFRSAPSAKIFTFNSLAAFIRIRFPELRLDSIPENNLHSFGKRSHYKIRPVRQLLRVAVIDKNGFAPRRLARGDVAPPISHDERSAQIDRPVASRLQKHSWPRFATGTVVRIDVTAHFDIIDRKQSPELLMDRLRHLGSNSSRGQGRLVRDHHQDKTR